MDTQTIIQASAKVVTITELKRGDVYKRIVKEYNGNVVRFGIVQDVMHNGVDAAFTTLEFEGYQYEPKLQVFKAGDDLAIFEATPTEVEVHLNEVIKRAEREVQAAEKTLTDKRAALEQANEIAAYALDAGLSSPQVVAGSVHEIAS